MSLVTVFVGMALVILAVSGFVPSWMSRDVAYLSGILVLCTGFLEAKLER